MPSDSDSRKSSFTIICYDGRKDAGKRSSELTILKCIKWHKTNVYVFYFAPKLAPSCNLIPFSPFDEKYVWKIYLSMIFDSSSILAMKFSSHLWAHSVCRKTLRPSIQIMANGQVGLQLALSYDNSQGCHAEDERVYHTSWVQDIPRTCLHTHWWQSPRLRPSNFCDIPQDMSKSGMILEKA